MKIRVHLVRALPGDAFATLARDPRFAVTVGGPPRDAEVLVPSYLDPVDEALLARMPSLRLVAGYGVGTDHLDVRACPRRGVAVTHTPGVLTEATADFPFALLLAVARRVVEADRFVRAGQWTASAPDLMLGTDVHGKVLGIVGHGRIGRAVEKRALGFGMTVLTSRPLDLDELLQRSDFVSLHVPLTDETRGMISRRRLAWMKPTAILINTARGQVVDEEALAEAVGAGHLGGAGLDVFAREPQVAEALLRCNNIVVAPHLGSGSREARAAMATLAAAEIARFADGKAPLHPVR